MRGLTAAVIGLLLVEARGFMSVERLKNDAEKIVKDTLPRPGSGGFLGQNRAFSDPVNQSVLERLLRTELCAGPYPFRDFGRRSPGVTSQAFGKNGQPGVVAVGVTVRRAVELKSSE